MRVNIYAEELTDRVEIIEKETPDGKFTGVRFYLYLPVTLPKERVIVDGCNGIEEGVRPARNERGPFIHREGDDDSAAVTFWGKKQLRVMLEKALDLLTEHYKGPDWGSEEKEQRNLSPTALSNLYTMGCTAKIDRRQQLPSVPCIPPRETRELRARLIMEEALETIAGLGFGVQFRETYANPGLSGMFLIADREPDLEQIIDGCCDSQYVTVGTLCACGVSDVPHMQAVNDANNAKFPNGKAIMHPTIPGKFGKPEGWKAPDHKKVSEAYFVDGIPNLGAISDQLVEKVKS